MISRLIGLTCLLLISLCAIAIAETQVEERPIRVECHGQLRHGLVAVGGETTGTVIKFNETTWELHFKDDAGRAFAESHHKKPISVTGALRRVQGVVIPVRWVVDVEGCTERDAGKQKEEASATFHGTLRTNVAIARGVSATIIEADGVTWPLAFTADATMEAKAKSLASKRVVAHGRIERLPQVTSSDSVVLRVNKLDPSPNEFEKK